MSQTSKALIETSYEGMLREPKTVPVDELVKIAIPLLKEYGEKLRVIAVRAQNGKKGSAEQADLATMMKRLGPPAKQLAQQVSQLIEHAHLDEMTRVELMLRLAEYEHAYLAAQKMLLTSDSGLLKPTVSGYQPGP